MQTAGPMATTAAWLHHARGPRALSALPTPPSSLGGQGPRVMHHGPPWAVADWAGLGRAGLGWAGRGMACRGVEPR